MESWTPSVKLDKNQHSGNISLAIICRKDWKKSSWHEEGMICFWDRKRRASVTRVKSWQVVKTRGNGVSSDPEFSSPRHLLLPLLAPAVLYSGICSQFLAILKHHFLSSSIIPVKLMWRLFLVFSTLPDSPSLTLTSPGFHRPICQFYSPVFPAYLSLQQDPVPLMSLRQCCSVGI